MPIFLRWLVWWFIIDTAIIAGNMGSPFLLIVAIIAATYFYWTNPLFKKSEPED